MILTRAVLPAIVGALAILSTRSAEAEPAACERMLSVGGGAALDGSWSAETTFGWQTNLGLLTNASVGFSRAFEGGDAYTYAEVGAYMGLTGAVGAGVATGGGEGARPSMHAFLGLPIPFYWSHRSCGTHEEERPAWMPYLEPYFRPRVDFRSSAEGVFEVGILLKLRINLYPGAWTDR